MEMTFNPVAAVPTHRVLCNGKHEPYAIRASEERGFVEISTPQGVKTVYGHVKIVPVVSISMAKLPGVEFE